MTYIATFFAHIGAVKFKKACDGRKMPARTMPVPRSLSSSCGVCVKFECDGVLPEDVYADTVERLVQLTGDGYEEIYRADGI